MTKKFIHKHDIQHLPDVQLQTCDIYNKLLKCIALIWEKDLRSCIIKTMYPDESESFLLFLFNLIQAKDFSSNHIHLHVALTVLLVTPFFKPRFTIPLVNKPLKKDTYNKCVTEIEAIASEIKFALRHDEHNKEENMKTTVRKWILELLSTQKSDLNHELNSVFNECDLYSVSLNWGIDNWLSFSGVIFIAYISCIYQFVVSSETISIEITFHDKILLVFYFTVVYHVPGESFSIYFYEETNY